MNLDGLTQKILNDADFPGLKSYIIASTGLSYFLQKDEDLACRIGRRFQQIGAKNCAEYRIRIAASSGPGSEFDSLVNELTIGETFFFRHTEQFDALRQVVLPKLIEKLASVASEQGAKTLRIWCAGCSTGAEPYTLSIILRHEFRSLLLGTTIEIVGTDINRNFLSRATSGHFDDWHLRSLSQAMKDLCFKRGPEGKGWLINEEFKAGVRFVHHNLISGQYPPTRDVTEKFDIIFCRNVMIYFSPETIAEILPRFDACLSEKGFPFLGYSEINTSLYTAFDPISFPGALLFQKKRVEKLPFSAVFPQLGEPNYAPMHLAIAAIPNSHLSSPAPLPIPLPLSLMPALTAPKLFSSEKVLPSGQDGKASLWSQREVRDLLQAGDFTTALKKVDEVLLLNTLDAHAHFFRGLILADLDRLNLAEEALKKAVYIDRKFVLAHYHLAMIYRSLGDSAKVSRYLLNVTDLLRDLPVNALLMEGDSMTVSDLSTLIKMMKVAS